LLNFDIELSLKKPVIGIDEVGRGPLAGPVVSCACIFLDYLIDQSKLFFFDDSKKLTSKKREEAFQIVHQLKNDNKLKYALGLATVNEIDSLNILEATKISMKRAVQKLQYDKANLIIDGKIDLELPEFPSIGIVNGGPGNLQKWQKNTNYFDDPLLFMESIPSRETRWFIEKVLTKYWIYNNKIGKKSNSLRMLAKGENPIY